MKQYNNVLGSIRPQAVEITNNAVYVAKNITPFEQDLDGHIVTGYKYDCIEYTKDEFLALQSEQISALSEELSAAKILLGVD